MQTNLWTFQDDITKSLNIEQYIQSEFNEINPQKINCRKSSAIINDVSIEFTKNNTQNNLFVEIIHNGETYISKNKLTKQNIEYLCGITNVKKFKIDEIIGSKIKFSKINNNSLIIKENYYIYEIKGILLTIFYFISFIIIMSEIYILEILIALAFSIIFGYLSYKSQQEESKNIFEFTSLNVKQ